MQQDLSILVTHFLVIRIGIDPILVRVGPIAVHWYGLMYVLGISAGLAITVPYAASRGIDKETYYGIFWPVLVACLIGGRLYYVVQSDFGWYLTHPDKILATWEGGMAFYGAVFLGTGALIVTARLKGVSIPVTLDVAALFVPVAQALGRIGNIINGDVIGYRSALPWATQYTNPANTFVPSHTVAYQPAAAYELLFSLLLFAAVWRLRNRLTVPASLFALWLVAYAVGQFFLFFERSNTVVSLGLKQAQLTSLIVVLAAVPAWIAWRRHWNLKTLNQANRGR